MTVTLRNRTLAEAAFTHGELVYHAIVRKVRTSSGSASLGLLNEVIQILVMVAMFYAMYSFMGLRGLTIRGDFVVFLLTGVFLFLTHNKAISSTMSAATSIDAITQHAPMTTIISILGNALSALYLQVLALFFIVIVVHVLRGGLDILNPVGLIMPFLLSWASGCAIGLLFMAARPVAPRPIALLCTMYRRANMVSSGKMVPANMMSGSMVSFFSWNPLFHTIDQARGHAFVNYYPHNSDLMYAVWFTVVALVIGLMGERWLSKNMSQSWNA